MNCTIPVHHSCNECHEQFGEILTYPQACRTCQQVYEIVGYAAVENKVHAILSTSAKKLINIPLSKVQLSGGY